MLERLHVFSTAYSIQGQSVQIISPSSESHQQVVAVGQPLTAQPQGTVVVSTNILTITNTRHIVIKFLKQDSKDESCRHLLIKTNYTDNSFPASNSCTKSDSGHWKHKHPKHS